MKRINSINGKYAPNYVKDKYGIQAYGFVNSKSQVVFSITYNDCFFAMKGVYYAPFFIKQQLFPGSYSLEHFDVLVRRSSI